MDTTSVQFLYPPNFDDNVPDDQRQGLRSVCIQMTGTSDGTGETSVKKLDISELRMVGGGVPSRTAILDLEWDMTGIDNIHLQWDRAPAATIAVLSGQGKRDYRRKGALVDPSGSGDRTGDILLTSNGAGAGGSYDIVMTVKLKA